VVAEVAAEHPSFPLGIAPPHRLLRTQPRGLGRHPSRLGQRGHVLPINRAIRMAPGATGEGSGSPHGRVSEAARLTT
jgi:hypothetical protein